MTQHEECRKCEGCGEIANDGENTPWRTWLELPLGSARAVLAGIVRPMPCPDCGGAGEIETP